MGLLNLSPRTSCKPRLSQNISCSRGLLLAFSALGAALSLWLVGRVPYGVAQHHPALVSRRPCCALCTPQCCCGLPHVLLRRGLGMGSTHMDFRGAPLLSNLDTLAKRSTLDGFLKRKKHLAILLFLSPT